MQPLKIAHVAPVATSVPPPRSGSVETMTSLLTEGLVRRGHDVTLFATGNSATSARLSALFPHGYRQDETMWPWEMYELLNLTAAVERADEFDLIHYQAGYFPMSLAFTRLCRTPVVQTLHHDPVPAEVRLWRHYPEAPFVAISQRQAQSLAGMNVVGVVPHGIDTERFTFQPTPGDHLLFLGRFTPGKGPVQAIEVARRTGHRIILAAAAEEYYRQAVAPLVDGDRVVYAGEADFETKVKLFGGARALLYPVQSAEPFGLVLAEAMACGTPVAALDRGAVREVVEPGVTGQIFADVDAMVEGLDSVLSLDRATVRQRAVNRFDVLQMVDGYVRAFHTALERRQQVR